MILMEGDIRMDRLEREVDIILILVFITVNQLQEGE